MGMLFDIVCYDGLTEDVATGIGSKLCPLDSNSDVLNGEPGRMRIIRANMCPDIVFEYIQLCKNETDKDFFATIFWTLVRMDPRYLSSDWLDDHKTNCWASAISNDASWNTCCRPPLACNIEDALR